MSTWDKTTDYYSGQGVVLIGERDADGRPKGLLAIGNVNALSVTVEETVLEHKESQSGQRSIDKRLPTETKCTLNMSVENFIAKNLAMALRGTHTSKKAGSVTNEQSKLYIGKVMPLKHAKVSSVVVAIGATTLTAYTDDVTPYDYKLNADAGSIEFNDGSEVLIDKTAQDGETVTLVTVGATTTITVGAVPAYVEVGGKATLDALTGADAANLNNKSFTILSKTATTVVLDVDTSGDTITAGTGEIEFDGATVEIDYSYEAQELVDTLAEGSKERYLRFEGLNTADGNKPVVVEIFKFETSPLQELALIGEEIQAFTLEGNVLFDALQTSGSKYFKVTSLK